MSSYINFFLKSKDKMFNPIGSFCRSSEIYQAIQYNIPSEKVKPLTQNFLSDVIHDFEAKINKVNKRIDEYQEIIDIQIPRWNNPASEKMESLVNYREIIEELKQEIDEYRFAMGYYDTLLSIVSNVEYEDDAYDKNKYIYAGIEVNSDNIEEVES